MRVCLYSEAEYQIPLYNSQMVSKTIITTEDHYNFFPYQFSLFLMLCSCIDLSLSLSIYHLTQNNIPVVSDYLSCGYENFTTTIDLHNRKRYNCKISIYLVSDYS